MTEIKIPPTVKIAIGIVILIFVVLSLTHWNNLREEERKMWSLTQELAEIRANEAAEARELELNNTFSEGREAGHKQGYNDAVIEIITKTEETGAAQIQFNENTTYTVFNIDGCRPRCIEEIAASGCNIICPGGGE